MKTFKFSSGKGLAAYLSLPPGLGNLGAKSKPYLSLYSQSLPGHMRGAQLWGEGRREREGKNLPQEPTIIVSIPSLTPSLLCQACLCRGQAKDEGPDPGCLGGLATAWSQMS